MKKTLRLALLSASAAALVSSAILPHVLAGQSAQTPPAAASKDSGDKPVMTLKANVREVALPVTVRDKKGQIVSTLKQEDFVLTDDGRPQTIKSFAHGLNLPLRLGLLIDTSRSQSNALAGERAASGKFVDQTLAAPGDKAFLLHFDHEVELLQDFTASKDKLHHELDDMTTSNTSSEDERSSDPSGQEGHSNRHRGGTQMYDAIYLACNELMLKQPGRKAIVVFSDGADRGSREGLGDAIDAAEKANVSVYTIYFKGEEEHHPMQQGMGGGHHGGMGGGGYPGGGGHGGGQRPSSGGGEVKIDGKKILEQIATRTGGRFFEAKKKESFDEAYAQIVEELKGQYLLTYSPDKPPMKDDNNDGFRKISLKTKDENLSVITREGYFASDL